MNNKRRLLSFLAALEVAASALLVSGCAAKTGPGIIYRVRGGKSEMALLGSIHMGNRDMQRFGQHIEDAIRSADVLVFECDTESKEAQETVADYQRGDRPLRDMLTPETYVSLERAAQSAGLSMDLLEGLHPWAVSSLLTSVHAAQELGAGSSGRAKGMGIEETVMSMRGSREIRYLETPQMQLEALCALSPELLDAMVASGCELVMNPGQSEVSQWPEWWQSGDTDQFVRAYAAENELLSPELSAEYKEALLTRRNQGMADVLCAMLEEEGRSFFVTVGLYHLVLPEDSVVLELEKRGYKVERVLE